MDVQALTRQNTALNEQVKLLVKTERRLYGAQRVIEAQLRRLEALNQLAINTGHSGDPTAILDFALRTLLEALDVDQAAAFRAEPSRRLALAAVRAQPGYEPGERQWTAAAVELPELTQPLFLGPHQPAVAAGVRVFLDAVGDYFAAGGPRQAAAIELVLPLTRKSRTPLGIIVLRKLDLSASYHQGLVNEDDLPFVELVISRVESAVDNVLLYREQQSFATQLEKKVEERTADLAHANEELAHSLQRVRETQEQLVEASKSAAVLTLVAGLSHELNNPIGVILGYVQGLLSRTPSVEVERRPLLAIERQARRCGQLVRALLGFAQQHSSAGDCIPPRLMLERVIAEIGDEAAALGIEVYLEPVAYDLQPLFVSAQEMHEALMHLVRNALDATTAGGTVALYAREQRRGAHAGVELAVRDSGAGIPAAFLTRIFDPFFTTKPPGKGVGLGLSLARHSIESHGGRIEVGSTLGRGTVVRVWLPTAIADRHTLREPERDDGRAS